MKKVRPLEVEWFIPNQPASRCSKFNLNLSDSKKLLLFILKIMNPLQDFEEILWQTFNIETVTHILQMKVQVLGRIMNFPKVMYLWSLRTGVTLTQDGHVMHFEPLSQTKFRLVEVSRKAFIRETHANGTTTFSFFLSWTQLWRLEHQQSYCVCEAVGRHAGNGKEER